MYRKRILVINWHNFIRSEKCIWIRDALLYFCYDTCVLMTTKEENDEYDDCIKSINAFSFGFFCTKAKQDEDNKHMLCMNVSKYILSVYVWVYIIHNRCLNFHLNSLNVWIEILFILTYLEANISFVTHDKRIKTLFFLNVNIFIYNVVFVNISCILCDTCKYFINFSYKNVFILVYKLWKKCSYNEIKSNINTSLWGEWKCFIYDTKQTIWYDQFNPRNETV